jgi:hypothetical protein
MTETGSVADVSCPARLSFWVGGVWDLKTWEQTLTNTLKNCEA